MINLQKTPKQFCENISIAFSKEFFVMGMMNGENGVAYTLTPGHMKRLMQYTAHQVEEFEKKYGEIQTEPWSKDIKSPLQIGPPKS
jgi:hypothetical protein